MKKTRGNIDSHTLGCKVGRAYQVMLSQLATALKEAGLAITTSEYLVLRSVYSKEGLQQCEISEMIGKDKAAVCRCVAGLESKGLLATESVSHKCLKVYLTDKSREIESVIMEVASGRHMALMALTTPGELEIFSDVLEKIIGSK
ncbi:MAG: MarR family transcriptional regulator [Muribaculaceae bacterium]|nr:MarR family transcriptional regulator [Muribaculaceae bacterium]